MKTNLSSISKLSIMSFMAFITAALIGCSNDITTENEDGNDGTNPVVVREGTVFSDETDGTRTSIGQNGWFYWETGDQIWVDENKDGTFSLESDDSQLATDKRTANFLFIGKVLADGPYDLTYTGNGSASGTSVTIKADQSQLVPNDSAHIGTSGDCATATATQQSGGNYTFTLNHKAHYLIFQPYKPDVITDGWRLMSIEIIDADGKAICGTYPFGMGGLDQTRPIGNTQSKVTLTCGGTDGFLLPNKTAWNTQKSNCYAVIAPASGGATTRNLKIKYNIKPTGSVNNVAGATFAVIKELSISSAPNKVTRIRHELNVAVYSTDVYYMWDAAAGQYYWRGVANPPTYFGASASGYPTVATDTRWYNTVNTNPATQASRSCKDLPNVNAATWYVMRGDPRWETNYPWCLNSNYAHIYTLGAWFLKWKNIPGKPAGQTITNCNITAPDINGVQRNGLTTNFANTAYVNSSTDYQSKGRPSDSELEKYFFLPAMGHLANGAIMGGDEYGIHGCYWLSSPVPGVATGAHWLSFLNSELGVGGNTLRSYGRSVTPDWFQ